MRLRTTCCAWVGKLLLSLLLLHLYDWNTISLPPMSTRSTQYITHHASRITHHAARITQHTTRNMQHATCNTQRNTQHATRNTQHATRNTQHATRNTQHATRNTQHATRNMQHATRNTQHTAHSTQHTAHSTQQLSLPSWLSHYIYIPSCIYIFLTSSCSHPVVLSMFSTINSNSELKQVISISLIFWKRIRWGEQRGSGVRM